MWVATGPSNSAVGDEADTDGVSLGLIVGASSGAKDEIGCGYAFKSGHVILNAEYLTQILNTSRIES